MKKTFVLLVLFLVSVLGYTQDIIVTKKSEQLKVKILEVSVDEIKYKELDNLEGPVFILKADEISSVIFSNGKVKLYDQDQVKKYTSDEEKNNNLDSIKFQNNKYIYRNNKLSKDEYVDHLKENCLQAYNKWNKGQTYLIFSKGILLIGGGSLLYGLINMSNQTGVKFVIIASSCAIASIPFSFIGSKIKMKSLDIYNANCAKKNTAQLNFNIKSNGIGLALNF